MGPVEAMSAAAVVVEDAEAAPVDAAEDAGAAAAAAVGDAEAAPVDAAEDAGAAEDGPEVAEANGMDEDAAAARIQAQHRGRADRRKVAEMTGGAAVDTAEDAGAADDGPEVAEANGMDEDAAAARIQAQHRGRADRRKV
eukprot:COSAG02_NODE_3885_length_6087_cov_7.811456_1_plen_139_part_10